MTVASAMGAHAAPVTIEWSGGTIEIKNLDWGDVACKLQNYLIGCDLDVRLTALDALVQHGHMTEQQRNEEVVKFAIEAEESGKYSFGGEKMRPILEVPFEESDTNSMTPEQRREMEAKQYRALPGLLRFLSLLMGVDVPSVMMILNEKRAEAMAKVVMVLKRSLPPKDLGPAPAPKVPPNATV